MRVRAIKREDIRVGAIVIDNKGKSWEIKSIQGEYIHFTERTYYSTIRDVLSGFTITEDKPTGIPTFDGDLPQGTKLDSGKLKPTLLLDDMPLAINEILRVLQFGAEKYSEGNWLKVPNGINRYRNAADRHRLAIDELDDESGLMHLAHEATSVLMLLELKLREKQDAE